MIKVTKNATFWYGTVQILFPLLILFAVSVTAFPDDRQSGRVIPTVVSGILNKIARVDGNTTGWMMKLDHEQVVFGMPVLELDIDAGNAAIESFSDRHVKIKGELVLRTGTERGQYPVILVDVIQ